MFESILNLLNWLVDGIKTIVSVILNIPTYANIFINYVDILPPLYKVFIVMILCVAILIKIKRLIL